MATNTYVALQKTTVSTATNSVTLSSIPQGYTDLILVMNLKSTSGVQDCLIELNGDTANNYSSTFLYGNGSTAGSTRQSNNPYGYGDYVGAIFTTNNNTEIVQFMNYSNSTTFKTFLSRANQADNGVDAIVNLWRSTSAITSIRLFPSAQNFAVGSTFSLYGIASEEASAKATGGIVTSDANYWYHTFVSSGTFTPTTTLSCDVLQVAGGAGGGSYRGGGGGAGGVLAFASQSVSSATTVTVGGGGAGGVSSRGTSGSNSQFASLTASVGGGNGGSAVSGAAATGANGGSGGGATATYAAGTGTSGQGNNGASGTTFSGKYGAGGGGGAGAAGTAGTSSGGGAGGAGTNSVTNWGTLSTAIGVSGYIAGGGAGGAIFSAPNTSGGTGGGGSSLTNSNGSAGTANTGSGGGGANSTDDTTQNNGGAGGSGVVIVRYAK